MMMIMIIHNDDYNINNNDDDNGNTVIGVAAARQVVTSSDFPRERFSLRVHHNATHTFDWVLAFARDNGRSSISGPDSSVVRPLQT